MGQLSAVGLFAGIGGIELGIERAGFRTELLCEVDTPARRVLGARFADVPLVPDVRDLRSLPRVDVVAAGFPCQDLSQAGRTAGIGGSRSGLVGEVFRLVSLRHASPTWLLIENVSFMLHLERGRAMAHLTGALEEMGFTWAYRVVDTRSFGVPQRRQRVIMLASRTEDPRAALLGQEAASNEQTDRQRRACGFYWTEGLKGLGWAVDAVPTLKGGSTVGIPSPPAILMPNHSIVTPDIKDAERLQGFQPDWTAPAVEDPDRRNGPRWRLVGNAVSVPVAEWVGRRIVETAAPFAESDEPLRSGHSWPAAAWGCRGRVHRVRVGPWPQRYPYQHLAEFLRYPVARMSYRALNGFLARARRSSLRFPPGLLEAVEHSMELDEEAVA